MWAPYLTADRATIVWNQILIVTNLIIPFTLVDDQLKNSLNANSFKHGSSKTAGLKPAVLPASCGIIR